MTADVKAAVGPAESPASAVAPEEAFTFAEPTAATATQEAWSIGEAEASEPESERPLRHARSGLPKTLIGAAALLALGAIAALLHFGTSPSTAANEQTDEAVAPQAANAGSGSGQPEAPRPSPAVKPSAPSQAKASRNLPPAAAPAPAAATADSPQGTVPTAAEKPVAPRDFDSLMREGRVALDRGELPAALTSFQAAAALKPLSVEAITGVARAQAASENTAAAIKSFERAVAVQNDYLPAWSGLAHLRAISGNTDGAIDAYRHILEINPNAREAKTAREALEDLGASSP